MARPRKDATLGHEAKARIVCETFLGESIASIASKHGISRKTLDRWREDLKNDPVLAGLVQKAQAAIKAEWGEEVPACLRDAIRFLRRAAQDGDPEDPEMVKAVGEALMKVSEVAATWKIIDARLAGQNRPASREAGQVAVPNNGASSEAGAPTPAVGVH